MIERTRGRQRRQKYLSLEIDTAKPLVSTEPTTAILDNVGASSCIKERGAGCSNGEEATRSIGNKTSDHDIGNLNSKVGKSRPGNDGLVERFSELFAETHLRSFWKEHQMNNEMPFGYSTGESVSNTKTVSTALLDENGKCSATDTVAGPPVTPPSHGDSIGNEARQSEMSESVKVKSTVVEIDNLKNLKELQTDNKVHVEINECHTTCSPKIELESGIDFEQLHDLKSLEPEETAQKSFELFENSNSDSQNLTESITNANNIIYHNLDEERIPRYFHGITTSTTSENLLPKRKLYKESTTFNIPFENVRDKQSSKGLYESHHQWSTTNVPLDFNSIDNTAPQLESESSTKLFMELEEFENDIEAFDLDITYVIDDIIRLKSQNEGDDETLEAKGDDESNELSRNAESTLHTIVEMSEPDTPRPEEHEHLEEPLNDMNLLMSDKSTDSITTSWTSGSKDTSYNCDDFLDENTNEACKPNSPSNISVPKKEYVGEGMKGGIYEYGNEEINGSLTQYEQLIKLAPTPPNFSPHLEEAAGTIQRAFRIYLGKREFQDSNNRITNDNSQFEHAASVIQKAFRLFRLRHTINIIEDHPKLFAAEKQLDQHKSLSNGIRGTPQDSQANDLSNKTDVQYVCDRVPSRDNLVLSVPAAATVIQKAFRRHMQTKNMQHSLPSDMDKQQPDIHVSKGNGSHPALQFDNSPLNIKEAKTEITPTNPFDIDGSSKDPTENSLQCSKNNAASTIQKTFRSYLQRKQKQGSFHSNGTIGTASCNPNTKLLLLKDSAATIIQKAFRRHLQMNTIRDKDKTQHANNGLHDDAKLNSLLESQSGQRTSNDLEMDNTDGSRSLEWSTDNAATIIQKSFRNFIKKKNKKPTTLGSGRLTTRIEDNSRKENPSRNELHLKNVKEDENNNEFGTLNKLSSPTHSVYNDKNKAAAIITRTIRIYNQRQSLRPDLMATGPIAGDNSGSHSDVSSTLLDGMSVENERKELEKTPAMNERNNELGKSNGKTEDNISNVDSSQFQNNMYHSRAATRIQKAYRNHRLLKNSKIISTATSQKDVAASIIQAAFRRYLRGKLNSSATVAHSGIVDTNELTASKQYNVGEVTGAGLDPEQTRYNASVTIQKAFRKYVQSLRQKQNLWAEYNPSAPLEEDICGFAADSLSDNLCTNNRLQDRSALIIQKAIRKFIIDKKLNELEQDLIRDAVDYRTTSQLDDTAADSAVKSNWYVGDEPIDAEGSPKRPLSEISFEETDPYLDIADNPPYVIDSACSSLEIGETNSTALISKRNDSDQLKNIHKQTNISEGSVSVVRGSNTERIAMAAEIAGVAAAKDPKENEWLIAKSHNDKYKTLIGLFIDSERLYSDTVNRGSMRQVLFPTPDVTQITNILKEFERSEKEQIDAVFPYETLEEPCVRKSSSITTLGHSSSDIANDSSSSNSENEADYSLSSKTIKLDGPEVAIVKMQQRRDSTAKISGNEIHKDYSFEEPSVMPINNLENSLDTDEEGIVVSHLQREETRESSGQSDEIICGEADETTKSVYHSAPGGHPAAKGSLKRVYTIANNADAKSLLKNVTIDESIKYIEPSDYEVNSSSFCLDDDTSENIRRKMMAYSLSEADSDCSERNLHSVGNSCVEPKAQIYDDFNVSTALVDNGDTSTETESTIVSAVTKIQAGARGYLTRKRLGRTSAASDSKSMGYDGTSKASFGNEAISESLEHLVKEEAAKRIQKVYRQHYRHKLEQANDFQKGNMGSYQTTSVESTLAQKRSMLQRGDALRNNSTPDEGNSSNGSDNGKSHVGQQLKVEMDKIIRSSSQAKSSTVVGDNTDEKNKQKWIAMRQHSMPVQIESDVFRVIPKHMRKRVKSAADGQSVRKRRVIKD